MQNRIYTFIVGVEQDAAPDPGTPSEPADVVPFSFLTEEYGKPKITGTWSSPYSAVAGTSIAHGMNSTHGSCVMYLKGNSGPVDMSADPQIAAGTRDGQELEMIFTSDSDTVFFEDGDGLSMPSGNRRSKQGTVLRWRWDEDQEEWRNTFWNNVGDIA